MCYFFFTTIKKIDRDLLKTGSETGKILNRLG